MFPAILAVVIVVAALTAPAHATFPGKNGRIAFSQDPDIYTMNPDGSDVRQLTALTEDNAAFEPNWSPDGKHLVFSEFPAPDFFGQLWMMHANGANQHLLLNDPGFDDELASFSPDGSHIVFLRCFPFHNEFPCAIYRIQADGTGLTALTPFRIELADFVPMYSPDGNSIAFSTYGRGGILSALYQMNPDGSNIHRLTSAAFGAYWTDWSPDGQALAFSSHCCNPDFQSIFTVRLDGRRIRRITKDAGKFNDFGVSWSPQGDAMVFQRVNQIDGTSGIWVVSADGSRQTLIRTIPPSAFRRLNLRNLRRPLRPGSAQSHPRQIEDGGRFPRWGVAQ
jgi:Tol biopolymer transport system component